MWERDRRGLSKIFEKEEVTEAHLLLFGIGLVFILRLLRKIGESMKSKTIFGAVISVCLVTSSLFLVSGATAAVTENECVNSGGHVSEGSGCKFCVGGKFDLLEIKDAGKNSTPRPESEQKGGGKASSESSTKTSGKN